MAAERWAKYGPPRNLERVAAEVSDPTCLYDTACGAAPNDQDSSVEVIEDDDIDREPAMQLAEACFEKTSGEKVAQEIAASSMR